MEKVSKREYERRKAKLEYELLSSNRTDKLIKMTNRSSNTPPQAGACISNMPSLELSSTNNAGGRALVHMSASWSRDFTGSKWRLPSFTFSRTLRKSTSMCLVRS
ncbi:hypothetical protein PIB30_080369 [Stylosanthes scabra]|uniref:Uncharacterized protein n=1 Tax=Stylosanthes scabra TaxID=79078 RepID=A0ABU6VTC8_9FABA|nr:hypothetical protein [Stylosanthes scabra]